METKLVPEVTITGGSNLDRQREADYLQERLLSELKDYLESLPRRQVKQENGGQTESLLNADDVFGWVDEKIKDLEASWPEEVGRLSEADMRNADMSMEAGARAAAMSAKSAEESMAGVIASEEEQTPHPRGQTPVFQHFDEMGYIVTGRGDEQEIDLLSAAAILAELEQTPLIRLALFKSLPDYRMDGRIGWINLRALEEAILEAKTLQLTHLPLQGRSSLAELDKPTLVRLALYKALPEWQGSTESAWVDLKAFEAAIEEMK